MFINPNPNPNPLTYINDEPEAADALDFVSSLPARACPKKTIEYAISRCSDRIAVLEKKLAASSRRRSFRRTNIVFDTNRAKFYRELMQNNVVARTKELTKDEELVADATRFWNKMWNKGEDVVDDIAIDAPAEEEQPLYEVREEDATFPDVNEFREIVRFLPNWRSPGPDGVYNFFVKRLFSVHEALYTAIKDICMGAAPIPSELLHGTTHLIPKGEPRDGSEFRPITCLSHIYKLITRCITKVLTLQVEKNHLLTEFQLGATRKCLGAKELALFSKALNSKKQGELKMAWLDARKAFDSIHHSQILNCLESLRCSRWIKEFIANSMPHWRTNVNLEGRTLIYGKEIKRGILQGDSLSPLLFCLVMDSVSRALQENCPRVNVSSGNSSLEFNHVIYIDDLKLFAEDDESLQKLLDEANVQLKKIGLDVNPVKSATNSAACSELLPLINEFKSYKYLGVQEERDGTYNDDKNLAILREEMMKRVNSLCGTKLSARNLSLAINEFATSLLEYPAGLIELEENKMKDIDKDIRSTLCQFNIHNIASSPERLYISRKEGGRGFQNVSHKVECSLKRLWDYLNTETQNLPKSLRLQVIKWCENESNSRLSKILPEIGDTYGENIKSIPDLKEAQRSKLVELNEKKPVHTNSIRNRRTSALDSSLWLRKISISPQEEASLALLQDRNLFWINKKEWRLCPGMLNTADHAATQCYRRVQSDYTRRHDEVVRCIGLSIARRFSLASSGHIRNFKTRSVMENEKAKLVCDQHVLTDVKVQHNKPDLLLIDKKQCTGIIIEVGVTSSRDLYLRESEKFGKYQLLADELKAIHRLRRVEVVSLVFTWDGLVTNRNRHFCRKLGLSANTVGYIQYRLLKSTHNFYTNEEKF